MSDKKDRDLITILGKPHTGKTTLIMDYIIKKVVKPIFIIDPQDEFKEGNVFNNFNDFYKSKNIDDVQIFKVRNDIDAKKVFAFCAYSGVECTLVVDEIDRYMNKHSYDEALYEILHYGAHNGISLISTSRRMQNIHNDVLSFSDFIISFAQSYGSDVKKIQRETGTEKELKGLKTGQFLVLTDKPETNKFEISNDRIYRLDRSASKLKENKL